MSSKLKLGSLFETTIGTNKNDVLDAIYDKSNVIHGMGGDDTISGGNLIDFLYGGAGHDLISGGGGNDILEGGAGRDTIRAGAGDDLILGSHASEGDSVDGGLGLDMISYESRSIGVEINLAAGWSGDVHTGDTLDVMTSVENARGSRKSDTITGNGDANLLQGLDGHDYILGGGGNDTIDGGGDDDNLHGGFGNDTILGGAGNDWLVGGAGADLLDGGEGIDTAFYDGVATGTVEGVRVNLATGRGYAGEAKGDRLIGIENLSGSRAADALFGDEKANRLQGLGGNDKLSGMGGNDTILGGAGADSIEGGRGADVLWGGERDAPDTERDTFVYRSHLDSHVLAADLIKDFDSARDRIDLSAIDANATRAGNQAFVFVGDASLDRAGQVSVRHHGGDTWIYANVDGHAAPDMAIRLEGLHELTTSNFIL